MTDAVQSSPEVAAALRQGRPVVALESTLIAHGLPWPTNLETARAAEAAVRAEGAVPATVAVWHGRPAVGLQDAELEYLARTPGVRKASRRDLAAAVVQGACAATTVAATLALAHRAGLRVFATGGIGGVRGPALTPFLLAQLAEITEGRTLRANQALIVSNARLAARVARALAQDRRDKPGGSQGG